MAEWTEGRRRKQAEAIRRWKPWEKSTGPKTPEGKERCSLNALKPVIHEAEKLLRLNREFRQQYVKLMRELDYGKQTDY